MYGYPAIDEISVVIFRYGGPGDDSLDLQMNYVLAIYQNRFAQELQVTFPKYGDS